MRQRNVKQGLLVGAMFCLLCATSVKAQVQSHSTKKSIGKTEQTRNYELRIRLLEKESNEPLMMSTVVISSINAYGIADMDGNVLIKDIPAGKYRVRVQYVGFETLEREIHMTGNLAFTWHMSPSSLALNEVVVVAKSKSAGESTSSTISRQAIDHLQAMSLSDMMQLIPGQLMQNPNMTSQSNLQIRTLANNATSAFGTNIVVDGVPMSNNGELSQGGFSSTAFTGTDLRMISADNVESVEVVRGIPSAEYGDLTSGLVLVNSKAGKTPLQLRAKIDPANMNYSVSKGWQLKENTGVLNVNLDYAKAWGDPRHKTRSFDRYTVGVGFSKDFTKKWNTNTRLRYVMAKDWNGKDPDAIQDGTFSKTNNGSFSLSHNGRIRIDAPLSRSLDYTLGFSYNRVESRNSTIVANPNAFLPILTATETGYHIVPFETSSYLASGGTISTPSNIYAKINNTWGVKLGNTYQNFKVGLNYSYDWNHARGYYNDNDRYPLRPNNDGRPRPFYDIPGLHQFAAYAEDNFRWNMGEHRSLKVQFGLRFTAQQPWKDEHTFSLSPRVNMAFALNKVLTLRGGYGLNSKTPGLNHLYPDKRYSDRIVANYIPQSDPAGQILMYHTHVADVLKNTSISNATNKKVEVGIDLHLSDNRKLSIVAFHDKMNNGFGNLTQYTTYTAGYFSQASGLIINPGQPTIVDFSKPERVDTLYASIGGVGNTNTSINKGIEFDFELGEIKALRTNFYLTGAYNESKSYSNVPQVSNPVALPTYYTSRNVVPFKLLYSGELQYTTYRRFVTTFRAVTNIPSLRMVASLAAETIWYNYSKSNNPPMDPIAWIDRDLNYHDITAAMLADENYMIEGVSLQAQRRNPKDNLPVKTPLTWNVQARLTKELGNIGGISFYANNVIFYEPFLPTSVSSTLVQRNTGKFHFGFELFFKL